MWLKKIFGKSAQPSPAPVAVGAPNQIALAEAKALLIEKLSADEASALSACAKLGDRLVRAIGNLRSSFDALARANVPEPRATASQAIKDGFAQRALVVLEKARVDEWKSIESAMSNLEELERKIALVAIGPREAAHMKFFFEEQMADIASRLRSVFDTISEVRTHFASALEKRTRAECVLGDIESCLKVLELKRHEAAQCGSDIARAASEIDGVRFHDLSGLMRLREELSKHEVQLADIDYGVSSAISPAMRLIRRFAHSSSDRRMIELVQSLESDAPRAFYDENSRIRALLLDSISAARSGKITSDGKDVEKAEQALRRFEHLLSLSEQRRAIAEKVCDIKARIELESEKERENKSAAEKVGSLENFVAQSEMQLVNLKREIRESEERLAALLKELAACLAAYGIFVDVRA